MTDHDIYLFQIARQVSFNSDYHKVKIGSILVYKKKIISVGSNSNKTHPLQKQYDIYRNRKGLKHRIHAEIDAIIQCSKSDLNGAYLYNYREDKDGNISNSRPCQACIHALKDKGIKRIFYTTKEGYCMEDLI